MTPATINKNASLKWTKLGRVYAPDGSLTWASSHAFPANPLLLDDKTIRVYLAFCDDKTVGRCGYVDVDSKDPTKVLRVSQTPVLDKGKPGRFDENGVLPTTVIRVDDHYYMYYVGYQLGQHLRYYQFQGLAISKDGELFERVSEVPVIDRSHAESVNRTSAFVRKCDSIFKMWYVGGSDWTTVNGKALPIYNIRYIESPDGIHWPTEGKVAVDYKDADEHALGRPWIHDFGGEQLMFFSSRTRSKDYRLGCANSEDGGRTWNRCDERIGIDVSESGWDSEMIAYGSIFEHEGRTYLFYNGNNCGKTGFGVAILDG